MSKAAISSSQIPFPTAKKLRPVEESQKLLEGARSSTHLDILGDFETESETRAGSEQLQDREISFFDGYEGLDGLPVRILKPSNDCLFTCFSYSDGGKHMATGENNGTIKLWSTKSYTLLNDVSGIFKNTVFPMKFVDGSEDTIVAIDESGCLKEIKFLSIGHETRASSSSNTEISVIRNISLNEEPIIWSHFSADGRTLVYECKGKSTAVHLCSFGESSIDRSEITVDKEFRKFPVLSNNGKHFFVLDLAEDDYDWFDYHPTVYVWKDLATNNEKRPAILPGDRAVWGPDGDYIAALWSDASGGGPFIAVYETQSLNPGYNNRPWRERKLSYGIFCFQAQILPRRNENDDIKILICEVGASQVRRFLVWNATKNMIRNDIDVNVNVQRSLDLNQRFDGPRMLAANHANPLAGMIEETKWGEIDPAGYMLVAEQDVYPKVCISKDETMIAIFSWRHHSCSIICRHSGTTICSFTLPEDTTLDPTFMLNAIQFDPTGLHLIVFGDKAIYACSPSFICVGESDEAPQLELEDIRSTLLPEGSVADEADSLMKHLDQSILAEEALFRLSNPADVDDSESLQEKTVTMVSILSDARLLGLHKNAKSPAKRSKYVAEGSESKTEEIKPDGGNVSVAKKITRSFLFESKDECGIWFAYGDVGVSYRGPDRSHIFNIDIDKSFAISLNQDRTSMMILDRKTVCQVNMAKEEVVQRIDYAVDFRQLTQTLKGSTKWTREGKWEATSFSGRTISDDGRTVLLGWDTKNKRSITVKPTTKYEACVEQIEDSEGSMSDFCNISRDGTVTTFVDTEDLPKGKLTVGIFHERGSLTSLSETFVMFPSDERVVAAVHVVAGVKTENMTHGNLCALLQCFFFDMTTDYSKIVAVIAGKQDLSEFIKDGMCIRMLGPWSRKGFVPDYNRLINGTSLPRHEAFQEAIKDFGFDNVFNIRHSRNDVSIIAMAIETKEEDLIDSIFDLAIEQKCRVQLDWKSSNEDKTENPINVGIVTKDGMFIKKIFALIVSGIFPFVQAAKAVKRHLRTLMKQYPEIVETVLGQDQLLVNVAQLKVLPDYLNAKRRQNAAIHINTTDNILEWQLDDNPEECEDRWLRTHEGEVEDVDQGEYRPKILANLQAICYDNAAGIGMEGIIRPLLIWKRRLSIDVFKSTAVKSVVLFKWYKIWRPRFIKYSLRYFVFLAVFTAYAVSVAMTDNISDEKPGIQIGQIALLIWIFLFGLSMSLEEIRQIRNYTRDGVQYLDRPLWGIKFFLTSKWNWVDVTSCGLLIFFIPLFHLLTYASSGMEDWLSGFIAIESIIASIKVWYFAQPFRKSGALVLMVENIVEDCLIFLMLAFFVLFGFALALHVLFRTIVSGNKELSEEDLEQVDRAFGTFQRSVHSMFYAMLGTFEPEVYSRAASNLSWFIEGIFSVYMITQMILLLNLLIAIMGDTFDKVKNREEAAMLLGRAGIIDASEAGMTESERESLEKEIGRYVQLLVCDDEEIDDETEWLGKVEAVERTFKKSFKDNQKMVREVASDLEKRMDKRSKDLEGRIETLGSKVENLEYKMEERDRRIGDQLDKLFALIEQQKHT